MITRCLLGVCLVAGCATTPAPTPIPPQVQADCTKVMDKDPEVQKMMLVGLTDGGQRAYADALRMVQYKAMQACLRSKGYATSGGVEPVQRGGSQIYGVK